MRWYEIETALKYGYYSNMESWEQTRLLGYLITKPYQKKGSNIKIKDLLPFEWDDEYKEDIQPMSAEEIKDLKEKVKQVMKR